MTPSSRNVFLDLGFPLGIAAHLLLRSTMMMEAEKVIVRVDFVVREGRKAKT